MANVDFKESAQQIVELVGGNDNIKGVTHCVTRVRFFLYNQEVAHNNADQIRNVKGVMQVIEAGGQYQVVIGPAVEKMYNEVVALTGKGEGAVEADKEDQDKPKGFTALIQMMSGIIMPAMPALIGCGVCASVYNILLMCGLVTQDAGFGMVLYGMGQACMYFMPVVIGGFAAKYFGMDLALGNALGAILMYPDFAAAADTTVKLFNIIPLTFKDYSKTVFQVIAVVWLASYIYKFIKKHCPDVLKMAMVPFLTILISAPIGLVAVGPIMNVLSTGLSAAIMGIYSFAPLLAALVLGAGWLLFIVPMGVHMGLVMIFFGNFFVQGYDPMLGLLSGILTLSGTLLAVALKSKNPETKSLAVTSAVSNFLGISEPGLYGVILQHKETIITSAIAGAVSNIFAVVFHTCVYSFGFSGIFALPTYMSPDGNPNSFIGAILVNITGFALAFALTYFWKFDVDKKKV